MAAAVRKAVADYNESNSRNVNDNYEPFWPGACGSSSVFVLVFLGGWPCENNSSLGAASIDPPLPYTHCPHTYMQSTACPIFDAANTLSESNGCRMLKFFRRCE